MSMNQEGQSLGGGSYGKELTTDEVRQRRLAALENRGQLEEPLMITEASLPSVDQDMPDELELQAALAMSLEKHHEANDKDDENVEESQLWTSKESLDIGEFHSIMWDSKMTTDNDKDRWVGQAIDIRQEEPSHSTSPTPMDISVHSSSSSRLSLIGSNHLPWGLTQTHGGPCGVLAAVQAELLRIILFGDRDPLSYPHALSSTDSAIAIDEDNEVLSPQLISRGLAMAISLILARSALMPDADGTEQDDEARIVLPGEAAATGLEWSHLEPWSGSSGSHKTDKLIVYKIESPTHGVKRQRTNGKGGHASRQERISNLAILITRFLMQEPQSRLNAFQRPGGVVLLAMSLVASRGASTIIKDMDDDAKLTSQFGHCSQELINLLLTGQAVSNVFDNTMTPSGSLTCRGIQQRPAVGYLTQLESLRYCEVGGYYKNPQFPIWVVGSTSHFTVMFGDASCLKESKSDELLEKCRRAFKEVDGVENGFISRIDLPKVYEILQLDVGGEHALQTLAATLEVNGADIILWDDFWKATSRLMMGTSLETVLQDESDEPPPLLRITQHGERTQSSSVEPESKSSTAGETDEEMARRLAAEWGVNVENPRPPGPAMTDEEYARKLQAEWDAEVSATASVVAVSGSPPPPLDDTDSHQAVADDLTTTTMEDEKMSSSSLTESNTNKVADFEKFGDTFSLYHYNGLRGGTLTPFRVTRLTAEEAVGASIALGAGGGCGAAAGGGDLEDVVRTKWPSCMVNWLGKSPPYID
jgi:hypothetical protein